MTRARDVASVLTAATDLSTDAETAAAISSHASAADPHPGYVLESGGSTITVSTGSTVPLTIQNNGTGVSFLVNDEAADSSPFAISSEGKIGIRTTSFPADPYAVNINGALQITQQTDISPNASGAGQITIGGNGYTGFTALNGTAMWIGHNSSARDLILAVDETERFRIQADGNFYLKGANATTDLTISAYNDIQKQQKIVADNEVMKFYSLSPNGPGFYWYQGNMTGGTAGATLRMSINNTGQVFLSTAQDNGGLPRVRNIYTSTSAPQGGNSGDVWFTYTA